ncbi:hypothetical protein [Clostridium beijerinckii]|uniref:Uncharacterized protein n=1 Tax=Clostridium beijerinckii TaxID=1520 RepID=A0A1S9MZR2_CLOBE|nr:hypothetical protein [Clostridium beijerinckii]MDG5856416.1 hypothetical protein [Clostridium beijerinckii]MZK50483.1 hypothetical protein [Clostridium beijerinckii]MZK58687.1 hypothetical protein [Clostridium beijerinckii]MZK68687.1 hypothetical protein [Clostridium beijerinckii]MZK74057.1 hypothetical protein [Clostridium beijerinckii]
MEKFIDRLSSYNVLNNMLPGAVFCYLLNALMSINILQDGIVEKLFIYYFVGMIISRIGSIIVEPLCKNIKLVEFAPYKEFIKASLKDDKISILSETNNTYRTILSVFLVLLPIKLYLLIISKFTWLANYTAVIVIILLVILFGYSYRKQTDYVRKRVKSVNESE